MLKRIAYFLMLIGSALAANPTPPVHAPNGLPDDPARYMPWARVSYRVCFQQWSLGTPGAASMVGAYLLHVTATGDAIAGSGWHPHTGVDDTGRGRRKPLLIHHTPYNNASDQQLNTGYAVTDITGCATFWFQLPGFSGWYTFRAQTDGTQEPCGCSVVNVGSQSTGKNVYVGVVDWDAPNQKRALTNVTLVTDPRNINLSSFFTNNSWFPDPRHAYTQGAVTTWPIRYVTKNAQKKLLVSVGAWFKDKPNDYPRLSIVRASLPDGGLSDNEMDINGNYKHSEWTYELAEQHLLGNEIDFMNPQSPLINNGTYADANMARFKNAMQLSGCYAGRTDAHGTPVSSAYWDTQLVIHVVCGTGPIGLIVNPDDPTGSLIH